MNKPYKVEFTQSAQVEAVKRGLTLAQLESYIRHEMEKDGYHGDENADDFRCYPPDLFFHTVDHDADRPWLVVGDGMEGVTVDSCKYEAGKPLKEGRFKGKSVSLPVGDEINSGVLKEED